VSRVRPVPGARAVTPVVGVALLVALTAVAAATVGAAVLATEPPSAAPGAALSLSADATGRVTLVHEGGDALAVGDLRVRIAVDGDPLARQPPVPFVGAEGFRGAPTGPFNAAADGTWTAGERAGVRVAETNDPPIRPGAAVRVRVYADGAPVADLRTTVGSATGAGSGAGGESVAGQGAGGGPTERTGPLRDPSGSDRRPGGHRGRPRRPPGRTRAW